MKSGSVWICVTSRSANRRAAPLGYTRADGLQDAAGNAVGAVSSGLLAPSVNHPIAMAYVQTAFSAPGTRLAALVRGKPVAMEVVRLPFIANRYVRG